MDIFKIMVSIFDTFLRYILDTLNTLLSRIKAPGLITFWIENGLIFFIKNDNSFDIDCFITGHHVYKEIGRQFFKKF